jgi:large subunit ribosomal protein L17
MRHGRRVKKLGRKTAHRQALLRNLVAALFIHGRVRTTLVKAKATRSLAERLLSFAKENTVAARRQVARFINDEGLVKKLFSELAPSITELSGGYTRIYRLGNRAGDGAQIAVLELLVQPKRKERRRRRSKSKA